VISVFLVSVMVVLLEFVQREIGNKKGPENEGLVRSLHAFSGRVRSTRSLFRRLGRAFVPGRRGMG
jgi:hypothetical protein